MNLDHATNPPSWASLFGKTSTQGDFLRLRIGNPDAVFVQRWIEESHLRRVGFGAPVPTQRVHFVIAPPGSNNLLVGALGPSRDAVGREFPLAVFGAVAISATPRAELMPLVTQTFVEACANIVAAGTSSGPGELEARLATLPPVLEPTARAEAVAEAVLAEQPVEDFSVRCLGSSDPAYLAYAIATIETAFAASKAPNEKELVLSFSLGLDVDLFAWLALITRIAPRAPTSFVWTEDVPTLLVTFGAPSTGLLGFIERTDSRSPNLWPVSTTNEQARADALSSLPVVSRQSLTHGASLGDFLSRIGRSA